MTPALVIALCALLFTVASFWWLHARPGRLRLTPVRVFSAYVWADRATLRIPVTLYNTGAKPLVVVDLRAGLSSAGSTSSAASRTYRRTIQTGSDDVEDFPHPYVVPGRSVVTKFVEFDADPRVMSSGSPVEVAVSALVNGRGWRCVGRCEIRADIIGDPGAYISYSNDPAHWPPGQEGRARAALEKVHSNLGSEREEAP
jgi:hypothetical protein